MAISPAHAEPAASFSPAFARRPAALLALAATLLVLLSCGSDATPETQPGAACGSPRTACSAEACVDLRSDASHCGQCGEACGPGLACSLGTCSSSCAAGLSMCGADCVALASDARNCGRCDTACASGQSCSAGTCVDTPSGGAGTSGNAGGSSTEGGAASGGASSGGVPGSAAGASNNGGAASGTGGATSNGGNAGTGTATGGAAGAGAGNGFQVGVQCFPVCASAATDVDLDGYGFEAGRSCVVAGSAPTVTASRCMPAAPVDPGIPPGDGFSISGTCHARCLSAASDPDPVTGATDGWGYEMGHSCVVAGSAPAMGAIPCIPPVAATGDGYQVGALCVPACMHANLADAMGYGYEAQQTCVVPASAAALQNARCALMPRQLPPPGTGFLHGETCFPRCGANALDVTAAGFGWDLNRTCVLATSTAAIQGVPCVPPAADVTGECPRVLTCPVAGGMTLQCGCTWIDGLAERKAQILATAGASRYFLASAMMETANLRADYTLGDGKTGDAFNAGLAKQNWGMIRRCHTEWNSQTAAQFSTSAALNMDLALDVRVYNECRAQFGTGWWSGHRNGVNNVGTDTPDIQRFKAAMDWTDLMLATHLMDDVRFWVAVPAI